MARAASKSGPHFHPPRRNPSSVVPDQVRDYTFSRKGRREGFAYFNIPSAAWRTNPAISRQAVSAAGMAPVKAVKPWARLS